MIKWNEINYKAELLHWNFWQLHCITTNNFLPPPPADNSSWPSIGLHTSPYHAAAVTKCYVYNHCKNQPTLVILLWKWQKHKGFTMDKTHHLCPIHNSCVFMPRIEHCNIIVFIFQWSRSECTNVVILGNNKC